MVNRTLEERPPSYEEATGLATSKVSTENTSIQMPATQDATSQDSSFYRMYSGMAKYDPKAFVYTICMLITVLLITLLAAIRISRETPVRDDAGQFNMYTHPNYML